MRVVYSAQIQAVASTLRMSEDTVEIRIAQKDDVTALNTLIHQSASALSIGFYNDAQIAALNRYVFGVDTALIADQSYFVVQQQERAIACGGWSKRRTLYGGDQRRVGMPELLDPQTDAAKIRAFFVHPDFARQGIGRLLLQHCEQQAKANGFKRCELMATLPGVPLYQKCGYQAIETVVDRLPDQTEVAFVKMSKAI